VTPTDKIYNAIQLLEEAREEMNEEEQSKKIEFLTEQIQLASKEPRSRRYSSSLTVTAAAWKISSPALYRQITESNTLSLPSSKHLDRLTSQLGTETGLTESSMRYLKARISSLSERERLVCLMIDEVYCEKRVEFVGGKLFGAENDNYTKTLLCYMIRGVAGSYQDMVAMIPTAKIDSKKLNMHFQKVISALTEIGFDLTCVSVDGHSANRKFYLEELCHGEMKSFISSQSETDRIHLLFDPVHLFKNYYSNFMNKKELECPDYDGEKIRPKWKHLQDLYNLELGQGLKYAYKLNQKVLNPRAIEKCNVKLSDSLFHESTIEALWYYSDQYPEWKETASFLRIIRTWFDIVNVRTTVAGIHKRNKFKDPVRDMNSESIKFLKKFTKWLEEWREVKIKNKSLSNETFLCAIQTSKTLSLLDNYLLEEKGLDYVLLGKINSDIIEGRFGRYRQMAGANYFVSVRQFLEAEKTIRLKSLVKYSCMTIKEIQTDIFAESNNDDRVKSEAEDLLLLLNDGLFQVRECEEYPVLYYVSGYIARSLLKKEKCEECQILICKSRNMPAVALEEKEASTQEVIKAKESFLDQVNRGGLVTPSDLIFTLCVQAEQFRKMVFENESAKQHLMSSASIQTLFSTALLMKMQEEESGQVILNTVCKNGHPFEKSLRRVSKAYCNCFMKNFVSENNDKLHESRKRMPSKSSSISRKIQKLN